MRRFPVPLFLVLTVIPAAGCGSSSGSPLPPAQTPTAVATADIASAAIAYGALRTDLNSRLSKISSEFTAATTDADLDKALNELAALVEDFKKGMSAITFPASFQADAAAAVAAADTVETTAKKLASMPSASWGTLGTDFTTQMAALSDASAKLRTDLGIPDDSASAVPSATVSSSLLGLTVGQTFHVTNTSGQATVNITLTKASFVPSFKGPNAAYGDDLPLSKDDVFMQVYVKYEALVSGVNFNEFDWTLESSLNKATPAIVLSGPKPQLTVGTLKAGETAEGWIVYEVPSSGPVSLDYSLHVNKPLATYSLR